MKRGGKGADGGSTVGLPKEICAVPVRLAGQYLHPGDEVGQYVVYQLVESGGFGAVYRAKRKDGFEVALKILHAERVNAENIERFDREVQALERLDHPNVVSLYEVGVHTDERPFLTMELLQGENLRARLKRGRFSPREALEILSPLVSALSAAHAAGIVHRDLKPSNVFLAKEGRFEPERVVLLDFGIAKMFTSDTGELTTSRHMLGTPATMAPEQIGRGHIDARTDVYGLGAMLYRMLTGRAPFSGNNERMVQHMHLSATVPRPSKLAAIPVSIDDVLLRALAKDQNQRQASVQELLEEFRDVIKGAGQASSSPAAATCGPEDQLFAVYVEVLAKDPELSEPDDDMLDDMDAVLSIARKVLTTDRDAPVLETDNSLMVVCPMSALGGNVAATLRDLVHQLERRPSMDPRVHFNVCVDLLGGGDAEDDTGAQTANNNSLSAMTTWAHKELVDAVIAPAECALTIGVKMIPIEGAEDLFCLSVGES